MIVVIVVIVVVTVVIVVMVEVGNHKPRGGARGCRCRAYLSERADDR